jgi:hypothetical protein
MLRLILDSHPSIAIPAETGFMGGLQATKQIPSWNFGKDWYQRLGWTEAEFDERLREFYAGLFERYAKQQGKPRWGEKTPFHTAHMGAMAQVFPDAVFVGIVRHPGAVAASLTKRFHYTFETALSYWAAANLDMIRAGGGLGERFTLCRYEDLVEEGEPVLRKLTEFLGEPWAPEMLEHHRVQHEKGAPRAAEGSTISSDPIDPRRAVAWTSSTSPDDLNHLKSTTGLARFLGYHPTQSGVRTSLDPDGRLLLGGTALGRKREAWRSEVDFDARPGTVLADVPAEELAARLAQVEQALARVRSRRTVRFVDAVRKVQHGRSVRDLRSAWSQLRGA